MHILVFAESFSICQVTSTAEIPWQEQRVFVSKTDEELSVVCPTHSAPSHPIAAEAGWRCFRLQGPLDFSLVGILATLSGLLAQAKIPIFAVSTYNTDYILVKQDRLQEAIRLLADNGYEVRQAVQ